MSKASTPTGDATRSPAPPGQKGVTEHPRDVRIAVKSRRPGLNVIRLPCKCFPLRSRPEAKAQCHQLML